jgi:uridine kinase
MKVCLLISGYFRNFETTFESLNKLILNKFDKVDIYLHITENENSEDKYLNNITKEEVNNIKKKLNPLYLIEEKNILFSENKFINNTVNLWYKYYKLNELRESHEKLNGNYDLVIKYRPDLYFFSDVHLNTDDENIFIPKDSKIDKNKLINIDDEYICDVFAYGNSCSMSKYFKLYEKINDLIGRYGYVSETILYHHIKDNIKYKLVDIEYQIILSKYNVFAICGDSGSGKTTLGKKLKEYFKNSFLLECDRYHKWERGDKNWEKFTHLHPNANFLTKMEDDIFNLKFGNDIYQVDYDHKNGKFTEKQLIEPSETTIVCGLHSLYTKNENLYNLKIFLDTDNFLKTQWKINRDVNERGYSYEKVITQIKNRKSDYLKYIKPQKNNSDIVIKFYSKNKLIGLEISINKKFNILNIINKFNQKNIPVIIKQKNNFFILDFKEYYNENLLDDLNVTKYNDFYDYILYIIINLIN